MDTIKKLFTRLFSTNGTNSDGVAPTGYAPHEDFESKRTTKLGMIFVIIMVISGVWQGQMLFDAVSSSITPPQQLSSCYSTLVSESGSMITVSRDSSSRYSNYSYQNIGTGYDDYDTYGNRMYRAPECVYTDIENKYAISALYNDVSPLFSKRSELQKESNTLERQLSDVRYSSNSVRDTYNTSLFETMTQSGSGVYSSSTLGYVLRTKEDQIKELENLIASKKVEINTINSSIKSKIAEKLSSLQSVANEFNAKLRWLELKRFLVSIVLLAPLAFFTLRKYFRSKNVRSEYAIIWAGIALISTILSTQLLVVFVYRILPRRILAAIAEFLTTIFQTFTFLFVVLQWLGLILVPLFFAFLVYKIQKKYYNKEAITMRALKDGKCPQCSMKIKDSMVFCPSCSLALRKSCASCKHTSTSYARYCEECGIAFTKETTKEA